MRQFILLLFSLTLLNTNVIAQPLNIVVNIWKPYVDDSSPSQGLATEIITTALKSKGYQPSLQIETWDRALEGLEIGIYQSVGALWKTPQRQKSLLFSLPYLENNIHFIKKKTTALDYHSLNDLKGYVIGMTKNYAYDESFDTAKNLIKIPQNHIIQNLLRLQQNQIDLTLGDKRAINYQLKQFMVNSINDFEFVEPPLSTKGLYFAVHRNTANAQKIISDFNAAIKAMKADGRYAAILKKY